MKVRRSAIVAAFMLASSPSYARDTPPLVVYIAGPVTGSSGSNGADMKAGALAAAQKINRSGGILGRMIEIRMEDDACDPKEAISIANRIVSNGGRFVIGHYCSDATKPASEVYNDYKVLHITPSQRPDLLQQDFNRMFRITPNAVELAKGYMDVVEKDFRAGNKAIAIIGNKGALAQSLSESLKNQLDKRGLPVTFKESYTTDERDYAAILTRMKAQQISMVLMTGTEKEMGMIVRQAQDLNYKPQFILSSTAASAGFPAMAGCAAQGVRVVAAWNPLYTPAYLPLLNELKDSGVNGIDIGITVYSAVLAIAQGIERAKSADPDAIAKVFHTQTLELSIGNIQFTASGELANPRVITYEYQSVNTPCTRVDMRPVTP